MIFGAPDASAWTACNGYAFTRFAALAESPPRTAFPEWYSGLIERWLCMLGKQPKAR